MLAVFSIGAVLIAMALTARFNMGLLLNTNESLKAAAALGAMIMGAYIGKEVINSVAYDGNDLLFSCRPMAGIKFFYNCGGWPVLGEDAKDFVKKLFEIVTNVALVGPAFASLIGGIYIQRQLITRPDFDWIDAIKIFTAGFGLMASILLIPKISTSLGEVLLSAGNYSQYIVEGQNNLASLVEMITTAHKEAAREDLNWWTDWKVAALRLAVFSLASIINYIGPCFILIQAVIFISAPVALLSAVLTEERSKEKAFDIGLKYANFLLIQVVYWTMFTLAPKIEDPGNLENLGIGVAGQAFGLAILVTVISVVLLIISAKYLAIPILLSTIRRVT